jgi:hypothetical protein
LARAVGLDVGARHVRLVEAEGGARGIRVVRLGERDLAVPEGGDREEAVREAVDALFRDTRASRDEVVLAFPAESCTIREVAVPFREADQIRRVVKFEFESHLHSQAIEDVVLDYFPTGESKDGTRLLCVAAPKAALRARLAALARIRVDPVTVTVDAAALASAVSAAGILEESPDCVVLDLGARSTKILVIREGRVRAARAFLAGIDPPLLEGPREGGGEAPAAGEGGEATAPAGDAAALAVAEDRRGAYYARAAREVARTLANAAPGASFPVLLVTGRESLAPGAAEALAAVLSMEVRPLGLLGRIAHPVPADRAAETEAVFSTALGAAAQALAGGPAAVDLRREDLAYARRFDQVKGGVAAILAFLLLGVGFLLWRAKTDREVAQREFDAMIANFLKTSRAVEDEYRKALGEEQFKRLRAESGNALAVLPDSKVRLKQMNDHLRNELGLSREVPKILSGLESLRLVNEAIRGVREKVDYCLVTSQEYTQRDVQITISLSSADHVDVINNAFREIKDAPDSGNLLFAGGCVYGTVQQNKQGKWVVSFTLTYEKK